MLPTVCTHGDCFSDPRVAGEHHLPVAAVGEGAGQASCSPTGAVPHQTIGTTAPQPSCA